jgi:predicted nucleic acid-binding protein
VIVLDTNVLSALMRTIPDRAVIAWLDRQPADSVWLTSVTVFETRFGLALPPKGRRRLGLDFDAAAATAAAQLAADRQRSGRIADLRDTLIAGIALARRATIPTRNTKYF